jgi:hypothetical protein
MILTYCRDNKNTISKKKKAVIDASMETGPEVNTEKT